MGGLSRTQADDYVYITCTLVARCWAGRGAWVSISAFYWKKVPDSAGNKLMSGKSDPK